MNAFSADIRAARSFRTNFIDLINKNYAVLLNGKNRFANYSFLINHFFAFFAVDKIAGVFNFYFFQFCFINSESAVHHIGQIHHSDLRAGHSGNIKRLSRGIIIGNFYLDFFFFKCAAFQHASKFIASFLTCVFSDQSFQYSLFRFCFGFFPKRTTIFFFFIRNGNFNKVSYYLFDIATDISDFRKFCRFNFYERSVRKSCQSSRDFRFSYARRSHH